MFLLIDNYDSFTYNLWHFLGQLGAEVKVVRNDKASVKEVLALNPAGIIISPLKAMCMSNIASFEPGVINIFSFG